MYDRTMYREGLDWLETHADAVRNADDSVTYHDEATAEWWRASDDDVSDLGRALGEVGAEWSAGQAYSRWCAETEHLSVPDPRTADYAQSAGPATFVADYYTTDEQWVNDALNRAEDLADEWRALIVATVEDEDTGATPRIDAAERALRQALADLDE